jgi:LacI family transcriptional regulator
MTDVATAAGVSQTTVSLVLNEVTGARLSQDTVNRVHEAAEQLGYRVVRRGSRRAPASGLTTLGFVVNEISTDPWMALALDGAREKAWEYGLTLSVAVTRGDIEMEQAVLSRMMSYPLSGLLYGTIHTQRIEPSASFYRAPTVLLNCYAADRSLTSVVPAEIQGGRTATRCLADAGHRRIAMIEGEALMDASRDRRKGYRQTLASCGIAFDPELVRPGNWEPSAGYRQTIELMRLKLPPTAIFCANDLMALGCLEALVELGLRVPQDISVVGYDNRAVAQSARPPLTTVLLPHLEMGAMAADLILGKKIRRRGPQPQIKVPCPLIERGTVAPPSRV